MSSTYVPSELRFQQFSFDERIKRPVSFTGKLATRPEFFGAGESGQLKTRIHLALSRLTPLLH